jgi:methylmalonyl-CoA mutase N-terminal domain/subunit
VLRCWYRLADWLATGERKVVGVTNFTHMAHDKRRQHELGGKRLANRRSASNKQCPKPIST